MPPHEPLVALTLPPPPRGPRPVPSPGLRVWQLPGTSFVPWGSCARRWPWTPPAEPCRRYMHRWGWKVWHSRRSYHYVAPGVLSRQARSGRLTARHTARGRHASLLGCYRYGMTQASVTAASGECVWKREQGRSGLALAEVTIRGIGRCLRAGRDGRAHAIMHCTAHDPRVSLRVAMDPSSGRYRMPRHRPGSWGQRRRAFQGQRLHAPCNTVFEFCDRGYLPHNVHVYSLPRLREGRLIRGNLQCGQAVFSPLSGLCTRV